MVSYYKNETKSRDRPRRGRDISNPRLSEAKPGGCPLQNQSTSKRSHIGIMSISIRRAIPLRSTAWRMENKEFVMPHVSNVCLFRYWAIIAKNNIYL